MTTTYVTYSDRDPKQVPSAILEVDDTGTIIKASNPDGAAGIPFIYASVPMTMRIRGVKMAQFQAWNRTTVFQEVKKTAKVLSKDDVQKWADQVYRVTTEQTGELVGYILVNKDTQTLSGYAASNPPTGYVEGMDFTAFQVANRGLVLEAVPDAVPLDSEDLADGGADEATEDGTTGSFDTSLTAQEQAALVGTAVGTALQASGVISKADYEQQIVYGWAYVTHDKNGILKEDKSGDFVDDVSEIEKTAVDFMLHHRASDQDHTNVQEGHVVESVVFTPEKRAAMGIPEGVLPNGWWVGVKCGDAQWQGYKDGKTAFSIHGKGTRKAAD